MGNEAKPQSTLKKVIFRILITFLAVIALAGIIITTAYLHERHFQQEREKPSFKSFYLGMPKNELNDVINSEEWIDISLADHREISLTFSNANSRINSIGSITVDGHTDEYFLKTIFFIFMGDKVSYISVKSTDLKSQLDIAKCGRLFAQAIENKYNLKSVIARSYDEKYLVKDEFGGFTFCMYQWRFNNNAVISINYNKETFLEESEYVSLNYSANEKMTAPSIKTKPSF